MSKTRADLVAVLAKLVPAADKDALAESLLSPKIDAGARRTLLQQAGVRKLGDRQLVARLAADIINERFIAVYINLDERDERREGTDTELQRAGLTAERFRALRGSEAPAGHVTMSWDTTLNARFDPLMQPDQVVDLTEGERGCAASHVSLWRRCADGGSPMLILEDDIELCEGCASSVTSGESARRQLPVHTTAAIGVMRRRFLPMVNNMLRYFDMALQGKEHVERRLLLYLGADVASWREDRPAMRVGTVTLREAEYLWQTSSYVIWPAAAQLLLSSLPVDAPVDNFLARHVLNRRIRALVCQPELARQEVPYAGDIEHSGKPGRRAIGSFEVDA